MIIDRILAKRIVPVVVLDSVEHAEPLAEALLAGGLRGDEAGFLKTPDAEKIILLMDNFNTYKEAFPPEKARTLCERFEFHYTPSTAVG